LIELLIRTLCDPLPDLPADGAYLFGQTADNQQSVFETGVDLVKRQRARRLLIPDSTPRCGYPGFRVWRQALGDLGLGESDIAGVSTASLPGLNTLTEAEALVRHARAEGMARILVVAPPFHQLRAFITTVSVVLREFPGLRVYNRVGVAQPWDDTVVHSQGVLQCTRTDLIHSEIVRIERYRRKGDLVSQDEVLAYLQWRDR
jgi:hypothetical protein